MGSAMLSGWLTKGLDPKAVWILDPMDSPIIQSFEKAGVRRGLDPNAAAAICILAVKPQMIEAALPDVRHLAKEGTIFLSIAAGLPISRFEAQLGDHAKILRAMPNTPAAIGEGITAMIGNHMITQEEHQLCEGLLSSLGETCSLTSESQMDAVTAVSGSGPAYVFYFIETLRRAAEAEGLDAPMAERLALATLRGAGILAMASPDTVETLRKNVTSPNGTTEAGLAILMDPKDGLAPLIEKTVAAAAEKSRILAK